jgi:predicted peroxiredoxin
MERKKLIFFASANPLENPRPARTAYHFASAAADAGLEAEVRLAGDAVLVATVEGIPDTALGDELREKVKKGVDAPFLVSL